MATRDPGDPASGAPAHPGEPREPAPGRTPGATTAQPVRTSALPKRNTSMAWAPGRSASSSSTEP